ncbi:MAG: GTP 3',8-cyclase MoaA [Chloroflexi bacterium]|nr:GTP 3',8-cyclase MoaA [Chloroflexota bacterium]MCC6565965.1 GTP 3',8-cyclase MoaA [Chloroflexota bacterium]MDL1916133.1 GTP 3',8-cyclase MoaA [Anaerolineae bacterium CFX4]
MTDHPVVDRFNRPLRDLRISVTDRCNFRCSYCMPEEIFGERYRFLAREKLLTFEEITRVATLMAAQGVSKLRLTGGEPLMRKDLEVLVGMLAKVTGIQDLAMTTNGYFLPEKAVALRDAGLKRITVSLDSLDNATFRALNGGKSDVDDVLRGIDAAVDAGFGPIKINAVVKRGVNDHTMVDLARWCKDNGHILRFIEYMDVGTRNGWRMDHVVPADEIVERVGAELPLVPLDRSYDSETALRFGFADGVGEIGVIAAVTRPFCGACSRLRLSPEGQIYTCLFAIHGVDLRDPLRAGASDAELTHLIQSVWRARTDRYSELRGRVDEGEKIEMYYIGG